MFDRPAWIVYVALFYALYLLACRWPVATAERRNRLRNQCVALGSLSLYALWSVPAALALTILCIATYFYSQQSRLLRAVSAPLFIAGALAYLAFVKYWGFGAELLGIPWKHNLFVIGISFYVFTLIGYLVDTAYRRQRPLERFSDIVILLSFWPHLAAGPILRLQNMREHLEHKARLSAAQLQLSTLLIAGGLAKKLFLADNFGTYVNANLTAGVAAMNGLEALATLLGFTAQIYFDFSGYSDIALGTAGLLGFRLPANFDYPYRAASLREFWSRWHISLSTWFRDYLYLPLGGNRRGNWALNLITVFALSGLWHGPAAHFIIWGLIHGLALALERRFERPLAYLPRPLRWLATFVIVVAAWAYFRLDADAATQLLATVFNPHRYRPLWRSSGYYVLPLLGLLPFLLFDHVLPYHLVRDRFVVPAVRARQLAYVAFLFLLMLIFSGTALPFIYIQF